MRMVKKRCTKASRRMNAGEAVTLQLTDAAFSACVRARIVVQMRFAVIIFRLVFVRRLFVFTALRLGRGSTKYTKRPSLLEMALLQTRFGPPCFARPANLDPRWSSARSTRVG